jgi:hypothetical protein
MLHVLGEVDYTIYDIQWHMCNSVTYPILTHMLMINKIYYN